MEVALSRILSTVGYHQPPVLPSSVHARRRLGHARRARRALRAEAQDAEGSRGMVVAAEPVRRDQAGLLVMMLMFNNSDIKNGNNTLRASIGQRHRALVRCAISAAHWEPRDASHRSRTTRMRSPPPVRSGHRERVRRVSLPRTAPGARARADHRGRSGVGQLPARPAERWPVAGRVSCGWICARCGTAIHPDA